MDNDVYGHVNNAHHYSLFDSAINRFLIERGGLDVRAGEAIAYVVSSSCDYFAPVAYPDDLEVGVRLDRLGTSSVRWGLALFRAGDEVARAAGGDGARVRGPRDLAPDPAARARPAGARDHRERRRRVMEGGGRRSFTPRRARGTWGGTVGGTTMRHALAAVLVALATGCADRTPPEPPAAPRDRPLAQDGTTARAITSTPDRVRVQVDLSTVRAALKVYRGEHDAWPRSIEELSIAGLNYPADLAYDPDTGTVRSRTYPGF